MAGTSGTSGFPRSLGLTPPYAVAFFAIMKYSKNPQAAKEFLKWLHGKDQFGKWFEIESGYSLGATTFWENHPMWERTDEALRAFRNSPRGTRMLGHAGPPTAKATEAYT